MSDSTKTMSDTNTEQAVLPTAPELPKVTAKMSAEDILKLVTTYMANADKTLVQLNQNIEKISEQLNKLQQMRLMVAGQRELVADMFGRITGAASETKQENTESK